VDLLLVATKYTGLPAVLPAIEQITVPGTTTVMSLLNGVDSEEIIAEKIGWPPIVHAYMVIASERTGSSIRFDPKATKGLVFGEASTPDKTDRCAAIEALFAGSQVHAHFVPNIIQQQWAKFCRNLSYNIPQAILSVGIGAFQDSVYVSAVSKALEDEVIRVGSAYGIEVPPY
jgi:2-dehydropantoate 2-reductase